VINSHDNGRVSTLNALHGLNLLYHQFGESIHVTHFEVCDNVVYAGYRMNHLHAPNPSNRFGNIPRPPQLGLNQHVCLDNQAKHQNKGGPYLYLKGVEVLTVAPWLRRYPLSSVVILRVRGFAVFRYAYYRS
jgi:hypothetical protein